MHEVEANLLLIEQLCCISSSIGFFSSIFNEIGITGRQDPINPEYETQKGALLVTFMNSLHKPREFYNLAILFHIYPPNRYKANKAYRKVLAKLAAEITTTRPSTSGSLKILKVAQF